MSERDPHQGTLDIADVDHCNHRATSEVDGIESAFRAPEREVLRGACGEGVDGEVGAGPDAAELAQERPRGDRPPTGQ